MAATLVRDVFSLQAFLSLRDFKFYFLSFGQRLVAVALDLAEMHEDVFLALALDEAKALGAVEPLHGAGLSGSHLINLPLSQRPASRNDDRRKSKSRLPNGCMATNDAMPVWRALTGPAARKYCHDPAAAVTSIG